MSNTKDSKGSKMDLFEKILKDIALDLVAKDVALFEEVIK